VFLAIERFMIRRSRVVIVICPSLEETVRAIEPRAHAVLIENAPGSAVDRATLADAAAVRQQLGVARSTPLVMYTGTFEAYQGIDLLFEAMAVVGRERPDARLVLAGGQPGQIERAKAQARAASADALTMFAGERPAAEIPAFLLAADVLVSPRCRGTNTPLKIYQYLRSGKPIVATRLMTHTQVLSDETAILTGTTAAEFARGILTALTDRDRALLVGRNARALADSKYTEQAYMERTREVCAALAAPQDAASARGGSPARGSSEALCAPGAKAWEAAAAKPPGSRKDLA
jgi:glycosyltransferase involved in cell wall biosynthesis